MPYDAIILGAGPAGCAAAYDLAHAGRHVLLLDRRAFPRPKACACGLTRKTLAALRYSVAPILERHCTEIILQPSATDRAQDTRIRSRKPIAAMAVREKFDAFCLHQTLAAGRNGGQVTFRKIESITALHEHPTHIDLTITTSEGPETLLAPILIGADGSNGIARRHAQSPPPDYTAGFALEATIPYTALPTPLPQHDAPHDLVFDFSPLPGGYGWLFPKADHINIGVGTFAPAAPATSPATPNPVTRQLLAAYTLQKLGVDLTTFPAATVTGQHLGMGGHLYTPRGRILLTGDAAGLVDPLTGEGIHSALVSGQAAARAVLENPQAPAAAYARHLAPLQQTLAFSARAARAFYANPHRGFRAMRHPLLRPLLLRTYTDGLPATRLLTTLARLVT